MSQRASSIRLLAGCAMLAVLAALLAPAPSPRAVAHTSPRPNIVLITTDDMRPGDLRAMPYTRRVLARRGVTFTDAISPFPQCCPARASILTGQYSHNHRVRSNWWPNGSYWAFRRQDNTLPVWLRRRGYRTALIGKYMNGYSADKPAVLRHRSLYGVPAGWTHWYAAVQYTYQYDRVLLNVDTPGSTPHRVLANGYVTTYLTRIATDLVGLYHRGRAPFFIWLSQIAPHEASGRYHQWTPPVPHPRDRGDFRGVQLPRAPAYRRALNETTQDKRGPMPNRRPLNVGSLRWQHQRRLESLKSVDRAVHAVVRTLKRTGEFHHTIIIFTSDNGIGLGEHRIDDKDMPYDAVLKIPLIVNAPDLEGRYRHRSGDGLVRVRDTATTIDIPATIIAASGARPGRVLDGLNLLRPRTNPDHLGGDRVVLIESGPARAPHRTPRSKFVGVRTNRWSWFAWYARPRGQQLRLGAREFYDRRTLPSQTRNIQPTGRFPDIRRRLLSLTQVMWDCRGLRCIRSLRTQ